MPSFSLRKLTRSTSGPIRAKRLNDDDNDEVSSSTVNTSSNKVATSKSLTASFKSKHQTPAAPSTTTAVAAPPPPSEGGRGGKFLGSKQRPITKTVFTMSTTTSDTNTTNTVSSPNQQQQRPPKRILSNTSVDSMAYSNATADSETDVFSDSGDFITAFDRCPPTFSDDVLDRLDIFPSLTSSYSVHGNTAGENELPVDVLEDSLEWTMFSDPSFENRNNCMSQTMNVAMNMGAMQREGENYQNYHHHHEVENSHDGMVHKMKSARLVSPESSPTNKCLRDGHTLPADSSSAAPAALAAPASVVSAIATSTDDDLSAWGLAGVLPTTTTTMSNRVSPTSSTSTRGDDDAFVGSNFFNNAGIFDDEGFFGESSDWMAIMSYPKPTADENNYNNSNNIVSTIGGDDPWGQMLQMDGDGSDGGGGIDPFIFEEKKDEDTGSVIFTDMSLSFPDPITPTMEHMLFNGHSLKQQHQQQQQQPHDKTNNEVVVSFEDYNNNENRHSPSNSSFSSRPPPPLLERNSSHERSHNNRPPVTSKSHRRINSNGSQGSRRRGGKSGGSVGSNSSAVDQILEHYRQKRLAAKQQQQHGHHGLTVSPATTSSTTVSSSQPSSSNHRSIPSNDSLSSVPSSALATATTTAPTIVATASLSPSNDTMSTVQSSSSRPAILLSHQQPSPTLHSTNQNNNRGVVNWPDDNEVCRAATPPSLQAKSVNEASSVDDTGEQFLMSNIEATIGPRGCAPDMESLSGRSSNRSPRRRNRHVASDAKSVDSRRSRSSRYSFRTYESNRSSLKSVTDMSPESQSVANDLFRLEAQLAEVARQQELQGDEEVVSACSPREVVFVGDNNALNKTSSSTSDMSDLYGYIGAEPIPRPNPLIVVAPPGKLGILLSNKKAGGVSSTPTHVSAVRSESVLAGKVQVGDQFMKIDGEDVSRLTSKEIMAIMARKSEIERVLEFRCLQSSYDTHEWI